MRVSLISILIITCFSCRNSNNKFASNTGHLIIEEFENGHLVKVASPFVNANLQEQYFLYPKDQEKPEIEGVSIYVPVPIKSAIVTSTTHVGYLDAINAIDKIKAANNLDLVYAKHFQQRVEAGDIQNIGQRNIDTELLVQQNADVIFAYAIDMAGYKEIQKWRNLNQSVVLIAEFMEKDPLAKANWLRLFGLLVGKESEAEYFLSKVKMKYDSLKAYAQGQTNQPSVFMGFPWKGTWYMSGGDSFQAKLFKDAGASYLWQDIPKESGMPLAVEEVLFKANQADFWLNTNAMRSLSDISENDERFASFKAYKANQVFNNDNRVNTYGGNDYWESGVVRPDLILEDLVNIFHVNTTAGNLNYYRKLD